MLLALYSKCAFTKIQYAQNSKNQLFKMLLFVKDVHFSLACYITSSRDHFWTSYKNEMWVRSALFFLVCMNKMLLSCRECIQE